MESMSNSFLLVAAMAVMLIGCGQRSAQQPSPPVPKITLTGITTILGNKHALLSLESSGNSQGPAEKLMLGEGERSGQVEVMEIDEKSASVRVRNSDVVTLLTLRRTP